MDTIVKENKVLLRYYPKTYYIGFSFANEKFGLKGSCWFIRCEQAKDDAMDVIFALPMIIAQANDSPVEKTHADPIDQLITDAEKHANADPTGIFWFAAATG